MCCFPQVIKRSDDAHEGLMEMGHDAPRIWKVRQLLCIDLPPKEKREAPLAALRLQAVRVSGLEAVVGRGHDELPCFGVFFIRVGPVLKIEMETIFHYYRIYHSSPSEMYLSIQA